jgi:mycofactocin system glycosyltransferase
MAVAMVTRFALDETARRVDDGTVLIAGSPLAVFRLSDTGARVLEGIIVGEPTPPGAERLTDRLLDAGAIHPRPDRGPYTTDDVTVVVPVRDADLGEVLGAIGPAHAVIVVDDASVAPISAPGAAVVRRVVNGGPAAARNTGLAAVTTPLVAFLDADCRPRPGWLKAMLDHFADDRVAAVAPRVASDTSRGSLLARYEAVRSPLDLGPTEARVRARTRVSYVPGAALVARADVLLASGGFDEDLRYGEDVDLVWRLDEQGLRVRYEPAAVVTHQPRRTWRAWLAQRASYGRSAAGLGRRHPGAVAPAAVSGWSAAVWVLAALGHPVAGAAVSAGTAIALADKLKALDHPVKESMQLAGLGHLFAGRLLAAAVTRVWWPLLVPLALVSKRVRYVLLASAVVPALVDWARTRPRIDPLRYVALRALDDVAYGVGVWQGVVRGRSFDPLVPDLTSWPKPSRYDRERLAAS